MEITKDSLIPFIGNKFRDLLQSGTNRLAEEIVQACENKISDYLEIEFERNNKTKTILHRHEPVELEKFYQPLFLKSVVEKWKRTSSKSKRIPTTNIEDLFSKGNCVTIIGTAGSGKSTLVKYLFVNSIKSDYKIPIKVELRYLNDYNKDLLSFVKEEIIKFSEIAKCDKVVDRMMSAGAFIIFFDGFDEVSTAKKETITKDICRMTKKYYNNLYVLTSRPLVNVDMLEGFVNYQVCELIDAEIESFVKKQFNDSEQELADRIIQTIKDKSSKAYRSFLSNPLLLSMFIITYRTDSDIPQKRSEYYNQVFNTLYSSHDTLSKLGYIREKESGLSKEGFVEILKRFSFTSYFQQKYSFSLEYFERQLNVLKKELHLSFSNDGFINDLNVAIGILTQDGLKITFPHRSLQEYFAALYVAGISNSNEKLIYGFLFPYFRESCLDDSYDNSSNFFSLLFEIDVARFKSLLVIPLLEEIKYERNGVINGGFGCDVLHCFNLLRGVSCYVNSHMGNFFIKKTIEFSGGKMKIYNELKDSCPDPIKLQDEGTRIWLNDYILPFLGRYDKIDDIIKGIKDDIAKSESYDVERIMSLRNGVDHR